jgi:lysine 2,3-aminomutase
MNQQLDKIAIDIRSRRLLQTLLKENPKLETILRNSKNWEQATGWIRKWVNEVLQKRPNTLQFYESVSPGRELFDKLEWQDAAIIRILDYIDHSGRAFPDYNLKGELAINNPFRILWMAVRNGSGGGRTPFFQDMVHLFRQFRNIDERPPRARERVTEWMARFPSGLDPEIVALREENKARIIDLIVDCLEKGIYTDRRFRFAPGIEREEKVRQVEIWWNDPAFHLRFAVREPDLLNKMLDMSLEPETMSILYKARERGIPMFVNPYYLSLIMVNEPDFAIGSDLAIRQYVLYEPELVDEFGDIVAWEKEDIVEPGEPNAAGWLLPNQRNIHRRYPTVAILIPDTRGRACGGLCASCQRMFDFQRGQLHFDMDALNPGETWSERLEMLMDYFERDSQLRDILITGGDALMNTDRSLKQILEAVRAMAMRKRAANCRRPRGEKFAEIVRVRLGTRLPVYLPMRITDNLQRVLADFREQAAEVGIRQFVLQTHFESPMEITPDAKAAIQKIVDAGWIVTNQLVFTVAASRRGHTARLRQVLNDVGVLPYYTFSVKGYRENAPLFATNARAMQEQLDEKQLFEIPKEKLSVIGALHDRRGDLIDTLHRIRKEAGLPFLATDRNVLNLPGVGKSQSFRTIGITRYGRRILEFDHDRTRSHSPVIEEMGKVVIIESKSISEYLEQLEELGENIEEYEGLYGYSLGETERRMPVFEYPAYDFEVTDTFTNFELPDRLLVHNNRE